MQASAVPADSLRRVVSQVFGRPEYEWIERRHLVAWLQARWQQLNEWMGRLSDQHPLGFNILLGLAVVALLLLLVHIGYVIMRIVRPAMRTGAGSGASATGGRIMDAAAHVARADELARAGRYPEALAHRFMAVLLELDRRQALRFHASKTPAEYIGEVRLDESGRASFTTLVAALYRHLFGAVPCDETEYAAFGAAAQELARGHDVVPA